MPLPNEWGVDMQKTIQILSIILLILKIFKILLSIKK